MSLPHIPDGWLLVLTLAFLLVLVIYVGRKAGAEDVKLSDDAGYKRPVFALEMRAEAAPRMFAAWDEATRQRLREAVVWDYLFLFIYPAYFAALCFVAARYLDRTGVVDFEYSLIFICVPLMAALFDALENFALLRVLSGHTGRVWPPLARWCAILKFFLLIVCGIYALLTLALALFVWLKTKYARA